MAFSTRLFVGNLPENLDEKALRNVFSSYGDITNFDLKSKPGIESEKKTFAFVTISGSNFHIESCIKHFANEAFQGNRLHVTRARESFLERLQREREQAQKNDNKQVEQLEASKFSENFPVNNRKNNKRKFTNNDDDQLNDNIYVKKNKEKKNEIINKLSTPSNFENNKYEPSNFDYNNKKGDSFQDDAKKQNSDKKRLESMKKKRQEFNEKKNIIKFGLTTIDKMPNKKVVFSDDEEVKMPDNLKENSINKTSKTNKKTNLFEDDASDEEINFDIKKQFEGKKGQKVLDLQSRYKSDKRFVLDERFVEDESGSEKEDNIESQDIVEEQGDEEQDIIELGQEADKSKQLEILQDVLGIKFRPKPTETSSKTKVKLGMLRFDPSQPGHAKYLAPAETKQEVTKKSKKKKSKEQAEETSQPELAVEKVQVSKEQFYKVSDTLKEAMSQPNSFSLRSLFSKDEVPEEPPEEDNNYIPIKSKKETKVKNILEPNEKNPFVYDSSESENEDINDNSKQVTEEITETKIVWREKLFFTPGDNRLKDGLLFFTKSYDNSGPKERRELKSLMKKRIYNKERKNTMFRRKIGGRKKTMKKKFKKG